MLQVLFESEGRPQVFTLAKDVASIGRAYDNQSTNGVKVNEKSVPSAGVKDGDQALIGTFVLRFREAPEPTVAPPERARVVDSTSTRIRPISEFNLDFGLEKAVGAPPAEGTDEHKRVVLDVAYKNKV